MSDSESDHYSDEPMEEPVNHAIHWSENRRFFLCHTPPTIPISVVYSRHRDCQAP